MKLIRREPGLIEKVRFKILPREPKALIEWRKKVPSKTHHKRNAHLPRAK